MFISNKITNTSNQNGMWYKIKELVLKTPNNNIEYNINSKMAENFTNFFADGMKERSSREDVQYKNQIHAIN